MRGLRAVSRMLGPLGLGAGVAAGALTVGTPGLAGAERLATTLLVLGVLCGIGGWRIAPTTLERRVAVCAVGLDAILLLVGGTLLLP
jgi:hypothetical protein